MKAFKIFMKCKLVMAIIFCITNLFMDYKTIAELVDMGGKLDIMALIMCVTYGVTALFTGISAYVLMDSFMKDKIKLVELGFDL